ncbi:hypothetical protein DFH06DRAFT_560623 [Mycena polygramma]|nr:hypothetical protein DFH06DRAFT_560623 [Mycena polygramma]
MPSGAPAFPLEIELEIFTTAAILYDETIPSLLRVAHRVLIWIEPLLYRKMLFEQSRQPYSAKSRLSAAIQSLQAKPLAFRENVRDIMWLDGYLDENLCTLLSLCTGVKTLVLWGLNRELADRISSLQLERLASRWSTIWSPHYLPVSP